MKLNNLSKENLSIKSLALVLIFAIATSATSFYLHLPGGQLLLDNLGLKYNDIVYGLYGPIFLDIVSPDGIIQSDKIAGRWLNQETATRFVSKKLCPLPYKDYKFEYPPVVASLWVVSTCLPIGLIFPEEYTPSDYYLLAKRVEEIHYYIQSFFIILAFIATVVYLYKLVTILNKSWARPIVFIVLPSTILYLIYNWDIITSAFVVASVYYLMNRKHFVSGLLLGLGISTKLLPILYAIIVVYDMVQKVFKRKETLNTLVFFVLGLIATGLIPYVVVLVGSYKGFVSFVEHHMRWYCENCIYMYVTQRVDSQYNRILAMTLVLLSTMILLSIDIDYSNKLQQLEILLASMIISTALNYVFSPQMMLLITPIAILFLSLRQLAFLAIADIANFGIMALFFKDSEIRAWLSGKLGISLPIKFSPWSPESPVQIVAMIRNIVLLLILIDIVYHLLNRKGSIEKKEHSEITT